MATTITGIYIDGNDFITFNSGDSRVYRFRNGLVRQLTHDHTILQELVDSGIGLVSTPV